MIARRGRRTSALVVGAALLLGACDFDGAYDLPLPGSPVAEEDGFHVTAEFRDVLNVVPRSPVMVDDVVVGEVTEVERVGWHAEVTLRVRKDVVLPDNVVADIRQVSLLGEKYVALEAPTESEPQGRLGDGDEILLADTGRNPEVEEVLGALSFMLSGGGVGQLGTITRESNTIMSGREDRLRSTLRSLEQVVGTIDGQKDDIIHALESLDNLAGTLNAEKDVIGEALDAAGPAIDVLADQHDELIAMLRSLERLGVVGTRVIRRTKEDTLAILADLEPVLRGLWGAGQDLGPGVNLLASFPFPKAANDIIQGDYADTITRLQLDLDNLYKVLGIGLPEIDLPLNLRVDQVGGCIETGSLLSVPCSRTLADASLIRDLSERCEMSPTDDRRQARSRAGNSVCVWVSGLPDEAVSVGNDQYLGGLLGKPGWALPPSGPTVDEMVGGAV